VAAQTPAEDEESKPVAVSLQFEQDGATTLSFEKDKLVTVVAKVAIDMPDVDRVNVQVALSTGEDLNIENADDVIVRRLYIDNTGAGDFALQPTTSVRPRLRFSAPEGQRGVTANQQIKWEIVFKNNTAGSPFSAAAAVTTPTSNEIIAEDTATSTIKVRTVMSIQQLWADGGVFMWPLGFALIIGIAFALERIWTLSWAKVNADSFFERLAAAIRSGGPKKAVEICDATRGPVAAVIREGLLRIDQGVDQVEKAIASAGAVEGSFLQRGMVVLASVTTIAPMLGFLGTVWGMVLAFKAIAEAGDVKPSVVADGISQALITTAAGLVIAIIIQTFHNFLISRINRIVIDMEETSTKLVDLLISQGLDQRAA